MLRVSELKKGFGSGRNRLEVLKGINLEIQPGELVALMGPSGCGKSTLLNIIGGLLDGDSGEITLEEFSYGTRPPSKVVEIRRKGVGWIFQDFHLLDQLNALDNVVMALELSGIDSEDAEKLAKDSLLKVGLEDRMEFIPDQLSGGERQRCAIARALINKPKLLVMDEPTGDLDRNTSDEVMELIDDIFNEIDISVVIATHDENLKFKTNSKYLLEQGKLNLIQG